MQKIFVLDGERKGFIYGGCGRFADVVAVRTWLESGGEKPKVDDTFHAMLIDAQGKCCMIDNSLVLMAAEDHPHMAVGSGREYAMAAMHLGCDAKRAVQVAMVFDTGTGGTIVELHTESAAVLRFGSAT